MVADWIDATTWKPTLLDTGDAKTTIAAKLNVLTLPGTIFLIASLSCLALHRMRLREFAAAGGPVLALEPIPVLFDGQPAVGGLAVDQIVLHPEDAVDAVLDPVQVVEKEDQRMVPRSHDPGEPDRGRIVVPLHRLVEHTGSERPPHRR